MLDRLAAAIKNAVTRGKVADTRIGPRTLLQVTGLDGVTQQVIELLLPPGYSARPLPGADIALAQVLGSGDHVVALGGDMAGTVIADLEPGEFGVTNGTEMIVVRTDHLQLVSSTTILCQAPTVQCTGNVSVGTGVSGTFTSATGQVITVQDGIITVIQ